jgi:hypothetical protein
VTESAIGGTPGNVRILLGDDLSQLPVLLGHVRDLALAVLEEPRAEDVVLTVDELVVNAVHHVGGEIVVDLIVDDDELRVGVSDSDPDFRHSPERTHAERYGLRIIDSLSNRWSVEPLTGPSGGKVVWAEFDLRPDVPGDAGTPGTPTGR